MSKFIRFSSKLTLSIFATIFLFSCSKDADLLSEYVITTDDAQFENSLLINDSFYMAEGQTTILMDVLNNDNVSSNSNITIIETSSPINGIVTINDDNTLTYKVGTVETPPEETTPEETTPEETTPEETTPEETTPEETTPEETTPEETTPEETTPEETTPAPAEDTFTYTAEVVNEETGERTEEQATVTISVSDNGPVKAFPSAYGGGSNATGGRGKALAIINSLDRNKTLTYHPAENGNDEYYEGGLFPAMQNENVGYIVFNISGNIDLGVGGTGSQFGYDGMGSVNNKTIFGQSAPQGGITLTGGSFRINGRFGDGNNLIFRYIRSRPIYDEFGNKRNINGIADDDGYTWAFLFYGGNNIMVDHCSASFSYDKNMGAAIDELHVSEGSTQYGVTFQNNLVADGHTNMYAAINPNRPNNPQDYIDYISFLNNVMIGANRMPNVAFNGQAEVNNNIMYDPGSKMINAYYDIELNHINNFVFDPGTSSNVTNAHQELGLNDNPKYYTSGNYYEGFTSSTLINATNDNKLMWTDFSNRSIKLGLEFFTDNKHSLNGIPNQKSLKTAQEMYQDKIIDKNAGANKYLDNSGNVQIFLDSFDNGILDIAKNRISHQWHQVSEWVLPSIPTNNRPSSYDTDNDGMADAWEIKNFGNLNQSYRGDFDGDGYENIEEYMNQTD